MNEEYGWIKIHRKIIDWEWFDYPGMFRLFFYLLVSANIADKQWRGMVIKRGQLVISCAELAKKMGFTRQQIRSRLANLSSTNEITTKTTNKYTIITVCNYDRYQLKNSTQQPANNHQITTTKERKNNKEEKVSINTNLKEEKARQAEKRLNFDEILEFFNRTMDGHRIPKIVSINERRKSWLLARLKDYKIEDLYEAFTKAANSSFLNGDGSRGFVANFDWIIRPNNFPKILEGNYDDRRPTEAIRPKASRNPLKDCVSLTER